MDNEWTCYAFNEFRRGLLKTLENEGTAKAAFENEGTKAAELNAEEK